MRVLVTTIASASHFYPMVPLTWALRAAGHDVLVAHPPGLSGPVAQAGLPAVVVGDEPDLDLSWRDNQAATVADTPLSSTEQQQSRYAVAMFTFVAESMADDLLRVGELWRPDVVMFEPRAYAGALVAQRLGVPAVRHLWGPDYTWDRWAFERDTVEPFFARHAAGPVDPAATLTVDPCPPSLQPTKVPRRLATRYVPYNGNAVTTAVSEPTGRPADGRMRVCLTWGTTTGRILGSLAVIQPIVAALSGLPVELLIAVLSSQRELIGDLPSVVRVVEDTPLATLLPRCDAVVHQGGAGTTITSVLTATPQLVMPRVADQFLQGDLVRAAGAGLCIPQRESAPDAIRDAVMDLIHNRSYRDAARFICDEVSLQPAPASAVEHIEALVDG